YSHGQLFTVSRDGALSVAEWPTGKVGLTRPEADAVGVLPFGRNLLVTTAGGELQLFDRDLEQLWSYQATEPATTPPMVHGGMAVFQTADGWLHAVDQETGKGRFRIEIGTTAAAPVGQDGVFVLTVR